MSKGGINMNIKIKKVKVTEVGPRDGFQSEKTILNTDDKIEVINNLIDAGFPRIEVSSFVSPKAIPQLADAATILENVKRNPETTLAALVPNARGALRAVDAKLDEIVVGSEQNNDLFFLLKKRPVVSGENLTNAQPSFDENGMPK